MRVVMQFPKTWEEFEANYGFTDSEEIYTNGARLIPSFRVEQWLEHIGQPEQDREFVKLMVRNSNGRPYYSIIYLEFDDNGVWHDFEGYSSYSLDVISDYLKKYFMPSAQQNPVKHGKWKRIDKDNMFFAPHILQCSICGNVLDTHGVNAGRGDANYCPVCGAKMEMEGKDENRSGIQ